MTYCFMSFPEVHYSSRSGLDRVTRVLVRPVSPSLTYTWVVVFEGEWFRLD